jgi:hypothetical protein
MVFTSYEKRLFIVTESYGAFRKKLKSKILNLLLLLYIPKHNGVIIILCQRDEMATAAYYRKNSHRRLIAEPIKGKTKAM